MRSVVFPARDLALGLRLSSGGIRPREYDDWCAELYCDDRALRVVRCDGTAATEAELLFARQRANNATSERQMVLSAEMAELLEPPLPFSDSEPAGAGAGCVHVDAVLLGRVLGTTGGDVVNCSPYEAGQRIASADGSYYTLIPPPSSKIRSPGTLPFGSSKLRWLQAAVKATAGFEGTAKEQTDQIILTVAGGQVWLSRGCEHAAVAAWQLETDGNTPLPDGRRLLLRAELAEMFSLLDEDEEAELRIDLSGDVHMEIPAGDWQVRSVSPPDPAGAVALPRIEDWMAAPPKLEWTAEGGQFSAAAEAAAAVAGYAPRTAATSDASALSVPYAGAETEKPAARQIARLRLKPGSGGMTIASDGWRYDRAACPVAGCSLFPDDAIRQYFADEKGGEITVPSKLLRIAARHAAAGQAVNLSVRETGNTEAVVVRPCQRSWFVLPAYPEIAV